MEKEYNRIINLAITTAINLYDELDKRDKLEFEEVCLYKLSSYIKSIACDNYISDNHSYLTMLKGAIECLLALSMVDNCDLDYKDLKELDNYVHTSLSNRITDEFNMDYVKASNFAFTKLPIVFDDCMIVLVEEYLPELAVAYKALNVILHPNDLVYTYHFIENEYDFNMAEFLISKLYLEAVEDSSFKILPTLYLENIIYKQIDSNMTNTRLLELTQDIAVELKGILDKLVMVDVFNGKEEYLLSVSDYIVSIAMDYIMENNDALSYKISLIMELIAMEYYTDSLFLKEDRIDLLKLLAGNTQARIVDLFDKNLSKSIIDEVFPLITKYRDIQNRDDVEDFFLDNLAFMERGTTLDSFIDRFLTSYRELNGNTEAAEDDYYDYEISYISSDVHRYDKVQRGSLAEAHSISMINNLILFELKYLNSILDKVQPMSKKSGYELKKVKNQLPQRIEAIEELMKDVNKIIYNI